MARLIRLLANGLALSMALVHVARGDVQLDFNVTTQIVPDGPASKGPTEKKSPLLVVLTPTEIVHEDGEIQVVYDFGKRRIYRIEMASKGYTDESLYSVLGFRVMEFQNRLKLNKVLEAANLKENPMPVPLSEHLFSLDDGGTESKIDRNVEEEMIRFSWDSKPLLVFSEKTVPVAPGDRERFVQFVRYVFGGHPQILKALSKRDGLPESLVITRRDGTGLTTIALKLRSHKSSTGRPYSLDGLIREIPAGTKDPLASLAKKAQAEGPQDHRKRADAIIKRQKQAFADKRGVDGFLAMTEYGLQTGEPVPGLERDRMKALLGEDEDIRRLGTALQPVADAKAASEAIRTLKDIRGRTDEQARHLLKIFEANNRSGAGETDQAEKLFLEALAVNRSLTGAWKDLGDLHFRRYDMPGAWLCWDIARAIAPKNKMLRPVNDFEARLLKDHPEYFSPVTPRGD